jgi:hypothetical protein
MAWSRPIKQSVGSSVCVGMASAMVAGGTCATQAQTLIEWSAPGSGLWSAAGNWSPAIVPSDPTHVAVLGGSGGYTVQAAKVRIAGFEILNPQASLDVNSITLTLQPAAGLGTFNAGTVRFVTQPNTPIAGLLIESSTRIDGPGRFRRGAKFENVLSLAPGVTFTNGPGHTMETPMFIGCADPTSTLANEGVLSPGGLTSEGNGLRSLQMLSPGDIRLSDGSKLVLELGPSQVCEQIGNIEGTVTLGGTLNVLLGPGATMNIGDDFPLVLGTLSGDFEKVNLPVPPFGRRWTTLRFENSYEIVIVCIADCDENFELTIDDFICFQTLFSLGDLAADCDASKTLTIDDFICFQTAFVLGC